MELEISKHVLNDIATAAVERLEGIEIAPATNRDTARDTAAALTGLTPSTISTAISGSNLNPADLTLPRRPRALKITRDGQQVTLDVGVNIEYGRNLLSLAHKARTAIAENIELMTGLKVREINVTVQGLYLPAPQAGAHSQQGGQA